MKIRNKIFVYNFLTTVFVLFTFVSLGSIGSGIPFYRIVMNVVLFGMCAAYCYKKEAQLQDIINKHRVKNTISLYSNRNHRRAA